jgi:uncharacterized DUF497 family protein
MEIRFIHDPAKNRRNIEKHGISFETAKLIFDGPLYSEEDFRYEYGEVRMKSIGHLPNLVVVVVIHVDYDFDGTLTIRIISARKADKREQQIYYENI